MTYIIQKLYLENWNHNHTADGGTADVITAAVSCASRSSVNRGLARLYFPDQPSGDFTPLHHFIYIYTIQSFCTKLI